MVALKKSQISFIEHVMAYPIGFGYVLNFSDRTISEFFEDEFNIDFYDEKYTSRGTSKRNTLICLLIEEDAYLVAKILRALWEHRESLMVKRAMPVLPGSPVEDPAVEENIRSKYMSLLADVEGRSEAPKAGGIDRYTQERTLDELVADIERDLRENKPETAVDRLHTYCVKKVTHLLATRGIPCGEEEALHARFGKYRKILVEERDLQPFTDRAMKSAISLFEVFNDIRNNHSLAHDNVILEPAEARYVFESVSAILVFLRAVEAGRYDE